MSSDTLSAEEAKLYDRGIRLWGVEAQKKLRESVVLVLGMTESSAELCKNVVLAGIARLVVVFADDEMEHALEHGSNMFVRAEDSEGGRNAVERAKLVLSRINELNSYVHVEALHVASWAPSAVSGVLSAAVLSQYDFVCVCDNAVPLSVATELNERCRDAGASFLDLRLFGTRALLFCDMPLFDPKASSLAFSGKAPEEGLPTKRCCPRQRRSLKRGPSYGEVLAFSSDDLHTLRAPSLLYTVQALCADPEHPEQFLMKQKRSSGEGEEEIRALIEAYKGQSEAAYVCAIVGGVASQEVIKELIRDHRSPDEISSALPPQVPLSIDESRRRQQARKQHQNATGQPLCNVLSYDCVTGEGYICFISKEEIVHIREALKEAEEDATVID